MKRREFLRNIVGLCSAIWLGQNLPDMCRAMAGEQATKLLTMRSGLETVTAAQQQYFWLEVTLVGSAEIIPRQNPAEFLFLLKNCSVGQLGGQSKYTNPYIKRVEVSAAGQQDCLVRLISSKQSTMPEMRYALIPSVLYAGRYRLRIEVGSFSRSTAIKERDLEIQENSLAFGPLETRAVTDLLVIHHVGMEEGEKSAADIHLLHLQRGWSGIGYHYVIHKNGMIERGRPRDTVGAHAYQHNKSSIGIVLDGNFEETVPTAIQLERTARLIAALSHMYTLSPDAGNVRGHRELNATLCPGKFLYRELPLVRAKALAYCKQ